MQMWTWVGLGVTGAAGLLAVISPRWFQRVACRSSCWIDTNKALAVFDKRVDIDSYVVPYSRLLGLAVLLAVITLAVLLRRP